MVHALAPEKFSAGIARHTFSLDRPAEENRGGQRAAFFNSLIVTAKLNDVDPQAWLADVLGRIASHPAQRLGELLPWNWKPTPAAAMDLDAVA